tara:strand:+ start:225 stop:527 length:303 start_codon:yes stop_codon:yes gene_type:complete
VYSKRSKWERRQKREERKKKDGAVCRGDESRRSKKVDRKVADVMARLPNYHQLRGVGEEIMRRDIVPVARADAVHRNTVMSKEKPDFFSVEAMENICEKG